MTEINHLFPHFVVEIPKYQELSLNKYSTYFAREEKGFDFRTPEHLIGTSTVKKIENKNVSIVYLYYENSLEEAKKKIEELNRGEKMKEKEF